MFTYLKKKKFAESYYKKKLELIKKVSWRSKEKTNFTYDLSELNKKYAASIVSVITKRPMEEVERYIAELDENQDLKEHYEQRVLSVKDKDVDHEPRFCRRIAWYAIIRIMKPKVIIETGVDKGLGALVITAALERNDIEKNRGTYIGIDINPDAGYLFEGKYRDYGKIVCGDSLAYLEKYNEKIDLFIHDSNHDPDFEEREYKVVEKNLSDRAILISDNAHVTDKLWQFSKERDFQFLPWEEKPIDHWYPGVITGFCFK